MSLMVIEESKSNTSLNKMEKYRISSSSLLIINADYNEKTEYFLSLSFIEQRP